MMLSKVYRTTRVKVLATFSDCWLTRTDRWKCKSKYDLTLSQSFVVYTAQRSHIREVNFTPPTPFFLNAKRGLYLISQPLWVSAWLPAKGETLFSANICKLYWRIMRQWKGSRTSTNTLEVRLLVTGGEWALWAACTRETGGRRITSTSWRESWNSLTNQMKLLLAESKLRWAVCLSGIELFSCGLVHLSLLKKAARAECLIILSSKWN